MNRKNMPLIVMLVAGAVTCVITFVNHYSVFGKLVSLLAVLLIFYFLGSLLKWALDYFDAQNEKEKEGEVIEKEGENKSEETEDKKETNK